MTEIRYLQPGDKFTLEFELIRNGNSLECSPVGQKVGQSNYFKPETIVHNVVLKPRPIVVGSKVKGAWPWSTGTGVVVGIVDEYYMVRIINYGKKPYNYTKDEIELA